jgi:hypothetical protein
VRPLADSVLSKILSTGTQTQPFFQSSSLDFIGNKAEKIISSFGLHVGFDVDANRLGRLLGIDKPIDFSTNTSLLI